MIQSKLCLISPERRGQCLTGFTDLMLPGGSEIMACRDWRSMVLSALQGHRTDQPGRNEGLVFGFFVLGDVCPSAALLRRELRIADQAVWPTVDHFDLQFVIAGLERVGDVHPARIAPDDAEVFAVERHLDRMPDHSKVKMETLVLAEN